MKRVLILTVIALTLGILSGCWPNDDDDDDSHAGSEAAPVWTGVSTGDSHAVALKSDGTLWAWGEDDLGQLGLNTWVDENLPMQVGSDTWTAVCAGDRHSLAMNSSRHPYAWGYGIYSQLCNPALLRDVRLNTPAVVSLDRSWVSMSAGENHTLVLKDNGTVWICGVRKLNENGSPDVTSMLVKVNPDTDWTTIDAGGLHNLALKAGGSLWAWGENSYGQLGIGSTMDQDLPCQVGAATDWSPVFSAGESHTVAVKADGLLWAWGSNGSGQLGDGTTQERTEPVLINGTGAWIMVSAGSCHTLAIRSDGTLWAWGCNDDGQLGIGSNAGCTVPVQVGTDADWARVSAGKDFSVAIKSGGSMWAWGGNAHGQLGNGTNISSDVPVPVGGE